MTATATSLEGARLTFPRIVRSEWVKLRTLRSTWWCAATMVVVAVLLALMFSAFLNRGGSTLPTALQEADTVAVITVGTSYFTQLIAAVLGVLVVSGEYGTGMIRSTFGAVPNRLSALLAKVLVLAVAMFVLGLVAVALTFLATAGNLTGHHIYPHLGEAAVWMPIVGSALYLVLVALLAFAVGALLRSTAGGIATVVGLLLVLPTLVSVGVGLTQAPWLENLAAVLPSVAGGQLHTFAATAAIPAGSAGRGAAVQTADIVLNGWGGLGVMIAWIAAFLVPALILVRRRDA